MTGASNACQHLRDEDAIETRFRPYAPVPPAFRPIRSLGSPSYSLPIRFLAPGRCVCTADRYGLDLPDPSTRVECLGP
jgi:hypothetical protein